MNFILDIIIIAILVLCIFVGYKKGLAKVGVSLISFILSILITFILYQPITNVIINNTNIDETIENAIIEKTHQEKEATTEGSSISTYMKNYAQNATIDAENAASEAAARSIAINAIGIIVMIALYLISRIAINILATVIDIIAKLPILKQFNSIGGIIYGSLKGLLIIYGALAIIFFVASVSNIGFLTNIIDASIITKFFYDNNIILNILF